MTGARRSSHRRTEAAGTFSVPLGLPSPRMMTLSRGGEGGNPGWAREGRK